MPSRVVFCFFAEMIDKIAAREDARLVETRMWAHGPHRVLEIEHRGERLAVVHAGVGAPLAGGLLEEAIASAGGSSSRLEGQAPWCPIWSWVTP